MPALPGLPCVTKRQATDKTSDGYVNRTDQTLLNALLA